MDDKNLRVKVALEVEGRKALDDASSAIDGLGTAAQGVGQKATTGAGGVDKLDAAAQAAAGQVGQAAGKLGELGSAADTVGNAATGGARGIAQLDEAAQGAAGQVGQAATKLGDLGGATERVQTAATAGAQDIGRLDTAAKGAAGQVGQAAGQLDALGAALKTAGVDTAELDRRATALADELAQTGGASAELADAQRKLAPVAQAAAQATRELSDAAAASGGNLATMGNASTTAKQTLADMKLELAAAGAAAYTIGRALGGAAREASAFESGMAEVSTLVSDVSGMDAQADAVRRLAREYGGDATGQAKALYQVISAGAEQGAEAIGILDQANKLAVGGVTDITTAADGLTSAMNAYGDEAGTATEVSDAFFVAMKAGKTTVGELSKSIGQVAPISAQAGVGLDELLAATAALTKGGTSTSESMTQLRAILTAVIKPSKEAGDTAAELGLRFDAQALKAKGLAGFLADVAAKTGGSAEVMAKLFGSVEGLGAVLALTGKAAKDFDETLGQMDQRAGATDEAFAKVADTSAHAAAQFKAALTDVQISAGQALTGLTPLLKAVTGAINLFNDLPSPVKTVVAGVGALAVAAVPAALAVNSIAKAVGLATTALGLQRAAVLALPVPLAAAAGATTALGAAAGASVAPVTAGAGAVGLMSRAVGLLAVASKALLGPWGVLLTALGYGASKFLDAKDAAEKADEANRKMLEGPPKTELAAKIKTAADETQALAERTIAAKEAAERHGEAVRDAAKALGVDLVEAATGLGGKFTEQSKNLDTLVGGLDKLQAQGVDSVAVLKQALTGLIDVAKTEAEFEAVAQRINGMGLSAEAAGELMGRMLDVRLKAAKTQNDFDQVGDFILKLGLDADTTGKLFTRMLDTRLKSAKTQQDFDDISASVGKLKAKYPELSKEIERWEKQAIDSSGRFLSQHEADLELFGIKSKENLQAVADEYRDAWDRVKARTDVSLADQIKAFAAYRATAIAANGGVESSQIANERAALRTKAAVAGLGDTFDTTMGRAVKATDKAKGKVKQLGDEAKSAIDKLYAAQRALDAYGPGANAGVGSLGGKTDVLSLGERNAGVKSTIQSDFSINQKSGTIGSIYTPPPDQSGDWEWVTNDPARPGGYWRLSAAGGARRNAAEAAQLDPILAAYQATGTPIGSAGVPRLGALPPAVQAWLDGGGAAPATPTVSPSAAPEPPAAAPAAAPDGAQLAAVSKSLTQLLDTLRAGGAVTRHEVVLTAPDGSRSTVGVSTEADVSALLAVLARAGARA